MLFFKKIRFLWNLTCAFLKRHHLAFLISLILGGIIFFSLLKIAPFLIKRMPEFKKNKKIGWVGQYPPEQLPQEILSYLSPGLTRTQADGSVALGLAKSWQIEEEGKKYTFVLKDDLFWHDGTPINSGSVNLNFSGLRKEIIDDKTLIFYLEEPFSPFINVVSRPIFKENFIGAGAYQLKRIKKERGLVDTLIISGPKENLTFKFYPTLEAAVTGFKLGEIDILQDLLKNPFSEEWQKRLKIEKRAKDDQFVALFFNTKNEILGDKTLRLALSYALKKDYENRALTSLYPKSWAFNPEVKTYEFSPEKAREYLSESQGEKEEPLILEISVPEIFLQEAEEIKKSWEEVLGIKVNIKIINSLPADYQILLTTLEVSLDPDQYALWHSTQPGNITHLESPKIDKLLEDGRKIIKQQDRQEIYLDFQRFLVEELPALFLYHPTVYLIEKR